MTSTTVPRETGAARDPLGPSLAWALSRILPGREETWLLRSVLHRGPAAHEAWRAFASSVGDLPSLFRTDTGGRKRLSPLLLASVRENELPADPGLLTILRTAWLREELRLEAFRGIARGALDALRAARVPFFLLKGTALAETVYPTACLRHAHDIDVLVPERELGRARNALVEGGTMTPRRTLPEGRGFELRHPSDTPVLLLTRLFRHPFYRSDLGALRARAREVEAGPLGRVPALSPADDLLHALGHASYCPSRSTLLWVTDAWMILRSSDAVDWDAFAGAVSESRLELPVWVMLRYLAEKIDAPVPGEALEHAARLAADAGKLRRDVALYGARSRRGRHPRLRALERPGWVDRLSLWRWQLFPSRPYVDWAYGNPAPAVVPFIYLLRPLTFATERLKWRILGWIRSWTGR
ncbi:MAG: nucleotidyltransferase family protein [Gemmatimonadota bacterium]